MKKNYVFSFALLVILSASQFVYANDVWVAPTSVRDFYGTWECSMPMSADEFTQGMLQNSYIDIRVVIEYIERGSVVNIIFIIDLNELLDDMANMPELRALGITKDAIWEMMSQGTDPVEEVVDGFLMTADRYFIRFAATETFSEATLVANSQGSIFFNTAKNKMRFILDSIPAFEIFNEITDEIILTKR